MNEEILATPNVAGQFRRVGRCVTQLRIRAHAAARAEAPPVCVISLTQASYMLRM